MYIPSHLEVTELDQQVELIREYPLGTMFSYNGGKSRLLDYFKSGKEDDAIDSEMCATHVPFCYVAGSTETGPGKLIAHLARRNQHVELLEQSPNCLVVFQSVDSYVSPEYYPLKKKTHKFVPTWDFGCVHVYGRARIIRDDPAWLLEMLNAITDQEEEKRPDEANRWKVSEAEPSYLERMMKEVVGIEIEISSVQCKMKFQQDQPPVNVNGVLDGYSKELDAAKAQELSKFTRKHYPRDL
ncbi:hypothetical protein C6P41_004414 [Kluyveromyces marxianus]|nr:hypothetical protein C6P41_004414 [Kluyveromyces marxianus]